MADDIEKDANLSLVELDKGETFIHFFFKPLNHHHSLSLTVSHSQLNSGVVRLAHDDLLIAWDFMYASSY